MISSSDRKETKTEVDIHFLNCKYSIKNHLFSSCIDPLCLFSALIHTGFITADVCCCFAPTGKLTAAKSHLAFVSLLIQQAQLRRMARKHLAKCQKQPWQQPCNLIVSHEETCRQFVSPSHEQTVDLKWPCLFSWKTKSAKPTIHLGKHIQKYFVHACSYSGCT